MMPFVNYSFRLLTEQLGTFLRCRHRRSQRDHLPLHGLLAPIGKIFFRVALD
jgi:hypothetical protein